MPTTRQMSDRHEEFLANLLGGRVVRGSGNQAHDQMDGKGHLQDQHYAFAWDGKSSLGQSIGVTRAMWAKAKEQAGMYLPMLALRFYRNNRLTEVDMELVCMEAETAADVIRDANLYRVIQEQGCLRGNHHFPGISTCTACGVSAYDLPGAED